MTCDRQKNRESERQKDIKKEIQEDSERQRERDLKIQEKVYLGIYIVHELRDVGDVENVEVEEVVVDQLPQHWFT